MLRHTVVDSPNDGDEVARQRRKRVEALLDRAVPGFGDVTLRHVLTAVIAADEEAGGHLDVDGFLTERGHAWRTVEMVRTCLGFVQPSASPSPSPLSSVSEGTSGSRSRPGRPFHDPLDHGGPDGH